LLNYYLIFKCNISVVELRSIDTLIKEILETIARTYQRNNFGTMKNWSSPKNLKEDNNEAYIYNYLTLVILLLLITRYIVWF